MLGASSELAPNMFGASSELASVMEFGFYIRFVVMRVGLVWEIYSRLTNYGRHME